MRSTVVIEVRFSVWMSFSSATLEFAVKVGGALRVLHCTGVSRFPRHDVFAILKAITAECS